MEHPITPPPELVKQWASESLATQHLCTQAARWGADQELDACCAEVSWFTADKLRAARRPKPPSEADQAIADLDALVDDLSNHGMGFKATNVRRALERLKELEALPE